MTLTQLFTNIANAIRTKKNKTGTIAATNFPSEILTISTGSEEGNIQTNFYDLFMNGNYGYFSPEMCEKLMNGTYVLEEV